MVVGIARPEIAHSAETEFLIKMDGAGIVGADPTHEYHAGKTQTAGDPAHVREKGAAQTALQPGIGDRGRQSAVGRRIEGRSIPGIALTVAVCRERSDHPHRSERRPEYPTE